MRALEKRIAGLADKVNQQTHERKIMKETLSQISNDIKLKDSKSNGMRNSNSMESVNELNKIASKQLLNLSQIQENRYAEQRKSFL